MNKETIKSIRKSAQETLDTLEATILTMPVYKSLKDWFYKSYSNVFLFHYLIEKLSEFMPTDQIDQFIADHQKKALALAYGLNENASDYAIDSMVNMPDFDSLPTLNPNSDNLFRLTSSGLKKINKKSSK